MNNKINNVENPSKNLSKQLREVVFTLSLGGLISAGTPVYAGTNTTNSIYGGMINNTSLTTPNINGKNCYIRDDIINNQAKNKNIYSLPAYNKNTQLGLSTEGEIANADFEIYDNRGRYAYFGKTDSKGRLIINKDLLLSNLQFVGYNVQNLDNYNQVFTIKVKGGKIQDKNMDFCTDKYPITSKGAYTVTGTLNQLNDSTISRISTLVENIVNGKDNSNLTTFYTDNGLDPKNKASLGVINEAFTDIIERVKVGLEASYGLNNSNNDKDIDYNDITKFSDLQSTTLNSLSSFAAHIQNGDNSNVQNIVNQAKTKMNLVTVDYEKPSNDYLVTLSSYMKGNKIYYSYFSNFKSPILYNNGLDVILTEGQVIYIKENYTDTNTSGIVSKLEVKNGKLYRDANIISSIIINNPVGGNTGNTINSNNGTPINGGNTGNPISNPIVNNGNGSYTNINTNNSTTINTIDESIDKVIADIQKELSADNSSTNLQKIIDEITSIEKEIEALKAKSSQNNTKKTNLQNEVNQLNQKLSSLKQTITNSYNKLDNNAKVLLESTLGTNQKQDAVNSILSGTQTKTATVGTKTFDKLPNKAQIKVSLDLLNTKAVELTRDVNTLKQILDRLEGIYKTKQKEYQDSVNVYNQYQTDKSKYQQVLQNLSNGISPLNFVLKNLNLNVGFIASRTGINSALSELNNRFNQYTYPESRNYQLDKTKKGLKDTGEKAFLSLLGHNSTISVDYGSNLSFPATIQLKVDGTNIQTITVNNSQHAIDTTNYMYRVAEKQIASKELNKLLPLENEKKEIAKRVLDNKGQYKQIKILGQDYYLKDKAEYDKAKLEYDRIKAKYDFKNNLLNGYKNLISNYGTGIDNVNTTNAQVTEKREGVKFIEVTEKETIEALGGKETSKKAVAQVLNVKLDELIKQYNLDYVSNKPIQKINKFQRFNGKVYMESRNGYPTTIKDSRGKVLKEYKGTIDDKKFQQYPFTIYIRFNNNGSDFPAEAWVEFKNNANNNNIYRSKSIYINSLEEINNNSIVTLLSKYARAGIDIYRNGFLKGDIANQSLIYLFKDISTNLWKYQNRNGDGGVIGLKQGRDKELAPKLYYLANYYFDYKYKYDSEFSNSYHKEVERKLSIVVNNKKLELGRELTSEEVSTLKQDISRGIRDGMVMATHDYVLQYVELIKDLKNLSFSDIGNGLNSAFNIVKNPIDSLVDLSQGIKNSINGIKNKLENLRTYEYSYGTTYMSTTVGFVVTDPYAKIANLGKLNKIVNKIDSVVLGLIENILNSKITKLGNGYISKFDTLSVKLVKSFDKDKQERFLKRMSLMDDATLKQYLDYPDNYIKNFEVGGKYNNTQLIDNIGSVQPIIYNGDKFKLGTSVYTTKGKYDFVIIKGEIKFGENHSFISKGVNVDYAGSITFSNSGKITRISNDSGHYKPNFDDISVVKNTLVKQYGIDTSTILIDNYFK